MRSVSTNFTMMSQQCNLKLSKIIKTVVYHYCIQIDVLYIKVKIMTCFTVCL